MGAKRGVGETIGAAAFAELRKNGATLVGSLVIAAALLAGDIAIRYAGGQQAKAVPKDPGVVTAREFRVVGKDGVVRATLGTHDDGSTALKLFDRAGKQRTLVNLSSSDNASVAFYDADEKVHAQFVALQDGGSGLSLHDKTGPARMVLTAPPSGSPAISLYDKEGLARVKLNLLSDGSASILVGDPEGKGAVGVASLPDGKAGITIRDTTGQTVYSAP